MSHWRNTGKTHYEQVQPLFSVFPAASLIFLSAAAGTGAVERGCRWLIASLFSVLRCIQLCRRMAAVDLLAGMVVQRAEKIHKPLHIL